ncbi:NHL repeat-containing protein [bacterium]|nr:NHL repeat-containing protein [bacterium]
MRFVTPLLIGLFAFITVHAQQMEQSTWIEDDFSGESLRADWKPVSGTWSADGERVMVTGGGEQFAMLLDKYIMYTKSFVIEAVIDKLGGGLVFNAEHPDALKSCHVVRIVDGGVTLGYMDFLGQYFETRAISLKDFTAPVTMRIYVDQKNRNYSVLLGDRNVALEELRFNSGYAGLYSGSNRVTFDSFRVSGPGTMDTPAFFMKSNQRQLNDLAYMCIKDDGFLIVNPVVGIVQRITSVGTYVSEISIEEKTQLRGVAAGDGVSYVVDAESNALRAFDTDNRVQKVVTSDLSDPRDVAIDDNNVYVLDKSGIAVFDKKLNLIERKAGGLFRDPRGIAVHGDKVYVADFGNGQVQVLDKSDMSVDQVIKEDLMNPWGVGIDSKNGDIYVADPGAVAVLHYSEDGEFIERIDPITIRGFVSPRDVLVRDDMVYVADFDRILGFKKGVLTIRPSLRIE